MNLIEEVGLDYFYDRFNGTMFEGPNGKPCFIGHNNGSRGVVSVKELEGPVNKCRATDITIPYSFFSSMAVFAAPEIGWRQAEKGKYLTYFSRNNGSYTRGLCRRNLVTAFAPVSEWAMLRSLYPVAHYEQEATKVLLAMRPEFTPMNEGIKLMQAGKILSFAASHRLAVVPDENDTMAILFNQQKVGIVTASGEIQCSIPFVNASIKESE